MVSYVMQRIAEIKADPALLSPPAKRKSFRSQAAVAAQWLAALGNDKRLLTVAHLMDGEKTVGDLASQVGLSQSALSQHLSILVELGILEWRADGARRYYSCKSEEAKAVIGLLDDLARNNALPSPPSGSLPRP